MLDFYCIEGELRLFKRLNDRGATGCDLKVYIINMLVSSLRLWGCFSPPSNSVEYSSVFPTPVGVLPYRTKQSYRCAIEIDGVRFFPLNRCRRAVVIGVGNVISNRNNHCNIMSTASVGDSLFFRLISFTNSGQKFGTVLNSDLMQTYLSKS